MRTRGFSLLEVLVAVGVMVALGAMVWAGLFGLAADSRFDEAVRRVQSAVVLARAAAQEESRPFALVAVPGEEGVTLVLETFEPGAETRPDAAAPIPPRRRVAALARGVRVVTGLPGQDGALAGPAESDDSATPGDNAVRVCVAVPDGSAQGAGPVYLLDDRRAARVAVSAWTGATRVEEVPLKPGSEADAGAELPAAGPDAGEPGR